MYTKIKTSIQTDTLQNYTFTYYRIVHSQIYYRVNFSISVCIIFAN